MVTHAAEDVVLWSSQSRFSEHEIPGAGRTASLGDSNFFTWTLVAFVVSSGLLVSQQTLLAWWWCCFIGLGWAKGTRRSLTSWPSDVQKWASGSGLKDWPPCSGEDGPVFRTLDSPVHSNYQWFSLMKRLRGWGGSTLRRLSVYCSRGCRSLIFFFYSAWAWPQTGSETCWCLRLTEVGKAATCFDNNSSAFTIRMWGLTAEQFLCYYWAWKYRPDLNPVFTCQRRATYWLSKYSVPSCIFLDPTWTT